MLEYFSYKKVKKHQAEKHAREAAAVKTPEVPAPILNEEDELFLERIVSAEGTPPPLPDRPIYLNNPVVGDSTGNDAQLVLADQAAVRAATPNESKDAAELKDKGKGKETSADAAKEAKKANRFSFFRRASKKDELKPTDPNVPAAEVNKEEHDINRVLDDLNMSAVNNRAFSMSKESQVLVQKFTVILKDLVNGVPTAYDDLVGLIEDSQGTLTKSYDHLPSFLQKLITTLPNKLTTTLAPELLAVAAEAQALGGMTAAEAGKGGLGAAAKNFLTPTSLKDLVTKPGAVAGMLKAIMNALKLRWPAFMGTNVLLSLGLFVLLFVFWYCHKRGKEVRIAAEEKARTDPVDSNGRIVELSDDPMLGNGEGSSGAARGPATPGADSTAQSSGATAKLPAAEGELHERRK